MKDDCVAGGEEKDKVKKRKIIRSVALVLAVSLSWNVLAEIWSIIIS